MLKNILRLKIQNKLLVCEDIMSDNKFEDILSKINEIKEDLKKDFGGKQFKYIRQDEAGPVAVYGSGDKQRTLAEHVAHMDLVNPKRHDMPETLPKEVEFHLKTRGKNLKFGSPDHLAVLKFINETHSAYPEYSHYVNNTLLNKTISVLEKLDVIEELIKSNYGPKKAGLYDPTVNQERKAKNVDKIPELGQNQNVKTYTSAAQGTASQQADKEAKEAKKKSKKMPVKVGTPEEIAAMNAKMSAEAAKPVTGISDVKKILPPGYIQLQPTDEELFGSLVVDPEQMAKAEKEWENTIQNFYSKEAVKLPTEDPDTGWVSGKSFNECFLTEEEKTKRNMHTGE